jgi:hypothetical protein
MRKGVILDPRDEVIYTALVGRLLPAIWGQVEWSQGGPDMAYQLVGPTTDVEWIGNRLENWKEWTDKSIRILNDGNRYVLFTDLTNFYDNIDLKILESNLRELDVENEVVNMLMACLRRWSIPHGKGIPQGYSASDVLAKLYMNSVDSVLKDIGISHLRYVDDIRIFCKSKHQARIALIELTRRLIPKGLALNTAKTEIETSSNSMSVIVGVSDVISTIHEDIKKALNLGDYANEKEIEEAFKSDSEKVSKEIFEKLFEERFSLSEGKFDKTLFHYLLTRLGRVKSYIEVDPIGWTVF